MTRDDAHAVDDDHALRERAWRLSIERQAPRWDRQRIVAALIPRRKAMVLAIVALFAMLPGLGIVGAVLQLSEGGPRDLNNVGVALGLFGPVSAAPAALLLVIAGLMAGRPGARALPLLVAALLLTLGGVGCGVGLGIGDRPIEGGAGTAARAAALFYGPFVLLLGIPALGLAIVAPFEIRRKFVEAQRRRIIDVLLARGSVAMSDLALAANASEPQLRSLLEGLAADGRLAVRVDDRHRRVYTARRLASRQALLVELVEARGRESLARLAAELREPSGVVGDWVAELREAGHLRAQVEGGWLRFDAGGEGAEATRSCDACGGPMKAVGRGLYHCAYCGAEVFV